MKGCITMPNPINENRCLWLDILKAFLALIIIMQHSISHSWTTLPIQSVEWQILNIFFLFSRMAVPLFIMCSGIGMLSKERSISVVWKKNIFNLFKTYLCWMCIYSIFDMISLYASGYTEIRLYVNAFLKNILFGRYHTWFIPMLLGLYVITPFLYTIAQKKEHLQYFIILSIVFTTILPITQYFDSLSRLSVSIQNIHMNFVVGYSMYYLLGYYIYHHIRLKSFKHAKGLFLILFVGACFISSVLSIHTQIPNQELFIEFSFIVVVLNSLLLIIFRQQFETKKSNMHLFKKISSLSKYGIAIYIMHPLFLWAIPENAGLMSLLYAIIIWGISILISILIKKIPFINKILYI